MAASSVNDFLKLKPIETQQEEVTVNLQGMDFTFLVQSLPLDVINNITVQNYVTVPPAYMGGPSSQMLDSFGMSVDIALAGVVEPNFKLASLQKHWNATGEQDLVVKMFERYPDQLGLITEKISELSNSIEQTSPKQPTSKKDVEDAKN